MACRSTASLGLERVTWIAPKMEPRNRRREYDAHDDRSGQAGQCQSQIERM